MAGSRVTPTSAGSKAAWCVTAPGGGDDQDREGLIGAALDGDYTRKSGTSMAAPIVSGALAVLMDRFPDLTPRQARDRLIATASLDGLTTATGCTLEGCGEAALRQVFGHGMINLGAALQPITPAALVAASGEQPPENADAGPVADRPGAHRQSFRRDCCHQG